MDGAWKAFPAGHEPHCRLFKNNRDGTFTDVTKGSGLEHKSGWGQACCVGDYNNDGHDDLFVTYYGQNVLYRNNGDGTFVDVTQAGGTVAAGRENPLEHGLYFCRLQQRRASGSVRRQLRGFGFEDGAPSGGRPMHLQRAAGGLRAARDCQVGRTSSIATMATARLRMSVRRLASGIRRACTG